MPALSDLLGEPRRRMNAEDIMSAFRAAVVQAGGTIIQGVQGGQG